MNDQVNYAKIQRIKENLDALVIGQFGTGFVTDAMLYESGIKATVAQHTSDLADIVQQKLNDFTYNLNTLKKTRSKKYLKVNIIGDSIGAGTGATGNKGFIWQLINSQRVSEGMINHAIITTRNLLNSNTWITLLEGLDKDLISSTDASSQILMFDTTGNIPRQNYKARVVYSKRPDGGTFVIKDGNDVVLDTINCNGTKEDGLVTQVYTISSAVNFKVVPSIGQKAYISHFEFWFDNTISHTEIRNFSTGGRRASEYTDEDMTLTTSFQTPDIVIFELLANDFSNSPSDSTIYLQKLQLSFNEAKRINADFIVTITCGNSDSETSGFRTNYVNEIITLSKTLGFTIIDYDKYLGGYTNANANGLMTDTVHPSNLGHLLMANILIYVLYGEDNPYKKGIFIDQFEHRRGWTNAIQENYRYYHLNGHYFDNSYLLTYDQNGVSSYNIAQPVIYKGSLAQLPKYAPLGTIAMVGETSYYNSTDWGTSKTTIATWKPTNLVYQTGSGVPSVTPQFSTQIYIDYTNNKIYIAKGTTNSADWLLLN